MPLPENNRSQRRASISAVILTFNNEAIIERLLHSISWMDQVVIVDSHSQDRTLQVIHSIRPDATVVQRTLDSFAAQRNYGLQLAECEWIMHFDSDMVVPPALRDEILQRVLQGDEVADVFRLSLREFFHDRPTHNFAAIVHTLHRRGHAQWPGTIDEEMTVSGKIDTLQHPVHHYGVPSFDYMVKKINHYSQKKAERYSAGERHPFMLKLKTVLMPMRLFLRIYFLQQSHKDGWYGFLYAAMRAFNLFLSYAKMWELQLTGTRQADGFERSAAPGFAAGRTMALAGPDKEN